MKNMKKLLSAVGLLAVVAPVSLSVIACGPNETKDDTDTIINSINEITDLGIDFSSEKETVIAVLNNEETGLAAKISKHQSTSKNFKKELFELDVDNVYKGAEKDEKVTEEEQIEIDQTYYFNFSYNKKANNVLVAVKVINTKQTVVEAIKDTSYVISTTINTSADAFKETINVDFIKSKLTEDIQSIFNDEDFSIVKITNAENTEIIDQDLQIVGTIEGHVVFNYATVENQETNLTITVNASDQQVADDISANNYELNVVMQDTVDSLKTSITTNNAKFIQDKLSANIKAAFNSTNFKISNLTKDEVELSQEDLNKVQTINAKINFTYGSSESNSANLKIVIKEKDITKEEFNEKMTERSESDPFVFTVEAYEGSNKLPWITAKSQKQIKEAFLKDYGLKVDISKWNVDTFSSDEMGEDTNYTNRWFKAVKRFNAKMISTYDELSVKVNVVFDVEAPK